MSTVADKLREARALIERGWTQEEFARSKTGRTVKTNSPQAVCWCAYGALIQVDGESDAYPWLCKAIDPEGDMVTRWNDAPERTQAEVLEAFDKAIDLAEQEASHD